MLSEDRGSMAGSVTLCWKSPKNGAIDKGQTHQLQGRIYVGFIDRPVPGTGKGMA